MDAKKLLNQVSNKFEQKDFQGALNDVGKLIQMEPNNGSNYMARGNIKEKLGDIQGSVDDFKTGIEKNPNDDGFRGTLAISYFKRNEWATAANEYSGIIKINPNNVAAYLMRDNCLSKLGNKQAALEDYSQVIKLEPNKPGGYLLRGRTFAEMGRMDKAKEELERSTEMNYPDNARRAVVHRFIGNVYSKFNQPEDAKRHWETALELFRQSNNPNNAMK